MRLRDRDRAVHLLFDLSVLGKAVDGVLEVVGGALLFFVAPDRITSLVRALTQHELSEDPHDAVAGFLTRSLQHLSTDTKGFAALFLLSHGAVKVVLVWALLRKQWWAYPVAMAAFALFLLYQLYRYWHTRSGWLLAISVVDSLVIVVTWLEYQRLRRVHELRGAPAHGG